MKKYGYPANRMRTAGNGPDKPIDNNDTPEGREKTAARISRSTRIRRGNNGTSVHYPQAHCSSGNWGSAWLPGRWWWWCGSC